MQSAGTFAMLIIPKVLRYVNLLFGRYPRENVFVMLARDAYQKRRARAGLSPKCSRGRSSITAQSLSRAQISGLMSRRLSRHKKDIKVERCGALILFYSTFHLDNNRKHAHMEIKISLPRAVAQPGASL